MGIETVFPGDPPFFDYLAVAGGWVVAVSGAAFVLVLWLIGAAKSKALRVIAVSIAGVPLAIGLLTAAAGWAVVGQRHTGDWAPVREMIRRESEGIASQLGSRRRLSNDEYKAIAERMERSLGEFKIAGAAEPVVPYLFYDYPYVGLAWGKGAVALLDPDTMLCLASD